MKGFGVSLGVTGAVAASLVIAQLITAQPAKFAAETRAVADTTSTLAGTWRLKQRLNPDGTPYRSKLEGVTYISMRKMTAATTLGPSATANVYAKESGVLDEHFFDYPKDIVGKPFEMESNSTWLVHAMTAAADGGQISVKTHTIARGTIPPFNEGTVLNADIRYNLTRPAAARAGAAVAPRLQFANFGPVSLTDLQGKEVAMRAMTKACCGMTAFAVTGNTMEISWDNGGKDTWTRSGTTVPAAFR